MKKGVGSVCKVVLIGMVLAGLCLTACIAVTDAKPQTLPRRLGQWLAGSSRVRPPSLERPCSRPTRTTFRRFRTSFSTTLVIVTPSRSRCRSQTTCLCRRFATRSSDGVGGLLGLRGPARRFTG